MPLWTLLGLLEGKQTAPWPLADGTTDRTACSECRATIRNFATPVARPARMSVRPRRLPCVQRPGPPPAGRRLRPLRRLPALHRSLPDRRHESVVRLGVRGAQPRRSQTKRRCDSGLHTAAGAEIRRAFRRSLHIRHVDAGSCNGCESELQALNNPFYNLHRLGIFFTASPRFADLLLVTGPVTNAMLGPLRDDLRGNGGTALGNGRRHLRRVRRRRRGRLCLRPWTRRRSPGRCLSARLPAQSRGDHPGVADVSRPRAAAREGRPACRMSFCSRPSLRGSRPR